MVKRDKRINKLFAFVCFKTHEEAQAAFEHISKEEKNSFGGDENLYVNWVQKQYQRKKELSDTFGHTICNTNLFTKNLKPTITEEELKAQFGKFGEITSMVLKAPAQREVPAGGVKFPDTQFAFINYKNAEDAKKALAEAPKDEEIVALYEVINGKGPMVFVTFHMKRAHFDLYRSSQRRNMASMMMGFPGFQQMGGGMPGQGRPMPFMGAPGGGHGGHGGFGHRGGYTGGRTRGVPRGGRGGRGGQARHHHHQQAPQNASESKDTFETGNLSIALIKANMTEFTSLDNKKQRNILGELLFPMVEKLVPEDQNSQANLAPKVTGMLIDLEVFEVPEIIEFIEDEASLKERVFEAVDLLKNEEN